MCGRFTQAYSWEEIYEALNILGPPPTNLRPRYNIAPTTMVDVIVDRGKGRELLSMRWGLIPPFWKPSAPGEKFSWATFNARAEEIETKASFRGAWKAKRHCIIPASGFYEWTGDKSNRQPHYFTRADGKIIAFAGLWDRWRDPATSQDVLSCTLIIHEPSRWMARYHNRMPAILEEKDFDAWLRGAAGKEVLKPAPEEILREWTVSTRVNKTGAFDEDPTLTDPTTFV